MTNMPLPAATAPVARPPTVLLVDDDAMVMGAVTMLLEDHGFTVIPAGNGIEALRLYREHKPDLVLTDIIMPEKEGITLIRELRQEFPEARIVAMSGGGRIGNSDYVTIATALGADAGLNKPFDDDQLMKTIGALIGTAEAGPQASAA